MRTFAQIAILVSTDADQRRKLLDQLLTIDDANEDTASTYNAAQVALAGSAADTVVDFGNVTNANTVLIIADQEVSVKLNGVGATAFRLIPVPAVETGAVLSEFQTKAQPGVLFLRGKITSIHLSNPNTTEAEALVVLVGEAP